VIPLAAVAIGGWLAWDTLSKRGPTITVTFDTAEGLQAGQSQLKFKEIVLGTVQSLDLTQDQSHVVVTVATTRQAEPLLSDKTVFWVVKPRLFAGNVSGLETLLSGSYIGMLPSQTAATAQRKFVGREDPPVLEANVPGHTFQLKSTRLGSISRPYWRRSALDQASQRWPALAALTSPRWIWRAPWMPMRCSKPRR